VYYLKTKTYQNVSAREITFPDNDKLKILLGEYDRNRKAVEKLGRVKLNARGRTVFISGETHDCDLVKKPFGPAIWYH